MKKIIFVYYFFMILLIIPLISYANGVSVTGITVSKNIMSLEVGQTEKIEFVIYPQNATNREVKWSSANSNIVTVNAKSEVKAISQGVTTIFGTTVDGGYTVKFTVNVTGKSSISSNKYNIVKKNNMLNEETQYILKIDKKTTVEEFKKNVSTYSNMKFYNISNQELGSLDCIQTGSRLKLDDNSIYVLIVTGDISLDGNVSVLDLARLKIRMAGLSTLDDFQEIAADVNYDGALSLTDVSILKMYLVGLRNDF